MPLAMPRGTDASILPVEHEDEGESATDIPAAAMLPDF
jgi:hypothetical protein